MEEAQTAIRPKLNAKAPLDQIVTVVEALYGLLNTLGASGYQTSLISYNRVPWPDGGKEFDVRVSVRWQRTMALLSMNVASYQADSDVPEGFLKVLITRLDKKFNGAHFAYRYDGEKDCYIVSSLVRP